MTTPVSHKSGVILNDPGSCVSRGSVTPGTAPTWAPSPHGDPPSPLSPLPSMDSQVTFLENTKQSLQQMLSSMAALQTRADECLYEQSERLATLTVKMFYLAKSTRRNDAGKLSHADPGALGGTGTGVDSKATNIKILKIREDRASSLVNVQDQDGNAECSDSLLPRPKAAPSGKDGSNQICANYFSMKEPYPEDIVANSKLDKSRTTKPPGTPTLDPNSEPATESIICKEAPSPNLAESPTSQSIIGKQAPSPNLAESPTSQSIICKEAPSPNLAESPTSQSIICKEAPSPKLAESPTSLTETGNVFSSACILPASQYVIPSGGILSPFHKFPLRVGNYIFDSLARAAIVLLLSSKNRFDLAALAKKSATPAAALKLATETAKADLESDQWIGDLRNIMMILMESKMERCPAFKEFLLSWSGSGFICAIANEFLGAGVSTGTGASPKYPGRNLYGQWLSEFVVAYRAGFRAPEVIEELGELFKGKLGTGSTPVKTAEGHSAKVSRSKRHDANSGQSRVSSAGAKRRNNDSKGDWEERMVQRGALSDKVKKSTIDDSKKIWPNPKDQSEKETRNSQGHMGICIDDLAGSPLDPKDRLEKKPKIVEKHSLATIDDMEPGEWRTPPRQPGSMISPNISSDIQDRQPDYTASPDSRDQVLIRKFGTSQSAGSGRKKKKAKKGGGAGTTDPGTQRATGGNAAPLHVSVAEPMEGPGESGKISWKKEAAPAPVSAGKSSGLLGMVLTEKGGSGPPKAKKKEKSRGSVPARVTPVAGSGLPASSRSIPPFVIGGSEWPPQPANYAMGPATGFAGPPRLGHRCSPGQFWTARPLPPPAYAYGGAYLEAGRYGTRYESGMHVPGSGLRASTAWGYGNYAAGNNLYTQF